MSLFEWGEFRLHSGQTSGFRINCECLTEADWAALARLAVARVPAFGAVEGVPTGGLALAAALAPYATEGPLLIVDDVLTTGASMEAQRAGRPARGLVAFQRGECAPIWVDALFILYLPKAKAIAVGV